MGPLTQVSVVRAGWVLQALAWLAYYDKRNYAKVNFE